MPVSFRTERRTETTTQTTLIQFSRSGSTLNLHKFLSTLLLQYLNRSHVTSLCPKPPYPHPSSLRKLSARLSYALALYVLSDSNCAGNKGASLFPLASPTGWKFPCPFLLQSSIRPNVIAVRAAVFSILKCEMDSWECPQRTKKCF